MSKIRLSEFANSTGTGNISLTAGHKLVGTDMGSIASPGTILQVKTAVSGPARQGISNLNPVAITGLSVTITPRYATSLIVVEAHISSTITFVTSFGVYRDGVATVSTSGFTNNNQPNMQVTTHTGEAANAERMYRTPVYHFEVAGSGERTYQIYATDGWAGVANTLYINNRASADMASFSHMLVMEVAQ